LAAAPGPEDNLVALDTALTRLAERDPVKVWLVEPRYFAGLPGDEAAEILGISARTAHRYWVYARAWLRREMEGGTPHEIIEKATDAGGAFSSHR
jgi:DNA-directed RNA polymerase specialized sigma24 family protein